MDYEVQRNIARAFGALNIASDWEFAIIPIPMLWHVQMSRCLNVNVCILLALGSMYVNPSRSMYGNQLTAFQQCKYSMHRPNEIRRHTRRFRFHL